MNLTINGTPIELDAEGYLPNPEEWSPEAARVLAQREGLSLTDEHWPVLQFMRRFHEEHQVAAGARFVIKHMADELGHGATARRRLFELFPYGTCSRHAKSRG